MTTRKTISSINRYFKEVSKSELCMEESYDNFYVVVPAVGSGNIISFRLDEVPEYLGENEIAVYDIYEIAGDDSGWVEYTDAMVAKDDGSGTSPDPLVSLNLATFREIYSPLPELQGRFDSYDLRELWLDENYFPEAYMQAKLTGELDCQPEQKEKGGEQTDDGIIHTGKCNVELHRALTDYYTSISLNSRSCIDAKKRRFYKLKHFLISKGAMVP